MVIENQMAEGIKLFELLEGTKNAVAKMLAGGFLLLRVGRPSLAGD
jgi:hypothetical protein